jgi:hypothetical protein
MSDVLAMLKLMDDRAEDLAASDHEANSFDIKAEMVALRWMVRGCLLVVAAELGVDLGRVFAEPLRGGIRGGATMSSPQTWV